MKHRTTKDLPFAKAGAEVNINSWGVYIVVDKLRLFLNYAEEGDNEQVLRRLLSEGWIEEVKPRECWVYWDKKKRRPVTAYEKPFEIGTPEDHELFKVREVLE